MQLGQRIKDFRIRQNLKVSSLAKKANVTKSYISHIEQGRAVPSLKVLEKIAIALNCPISDLLPPNVSFRKEKNLKPESEVPPCPDAATSSSTSAP